MPFGKTSMPETLWERTRADSVLRAEINAPLSDPAHVDDGHVYHQLADLRQMAVAVPPPAPPPPPSEVELRQQLHAALDHQHDAEAKAEQAEQARLRAERFYSEKNI